MKRLLNAAFTITLTLSLTLTLAGCGGTGGSASSDDGAGPDTSGSASSDSGVIATVDELRAALARDHADAEWYPDITDITLETYLGAPVITFHVPWYTPGADYDTQNRKRWALSDALGAYDIEAAPNLALRDGSGTIAVIGGGGVGAAPMQEVFDLPPAPQSAEEVRSWLAAVYGPGGLVPLGPDETWYDMIVSIEMGDYGSGANDVLVVTTNAPTSLSTEASLITMALQTTGSPLLERYSIRTADGNGSSGSASVTEPGAGGWLYPVQ